MQYRDEQEVEHRCSRIAYVSLIIPKKITNYNKSLYDRIQQRPYPASTHLEIYSNSDFLFFPIFFCIAAALSYLCDFSWRTNKRV